MITMTLLYACKRNIMGNQKSKQINKTVTAEEILGNPTYQAISYGGYRTNSREVQPTVAQIKDDMKILSAMGIKVLRTYNTHYDHASTVLKAIRELKEENPHFEMYVMLGVWIDCLNAFTPYPDHNQEDEVANAAEIDRAMNMAIQYPDIVKIIAVGNEAMVKWAASYYVQPAVILKWVNFLQIKKMEGILPTDLWITSSDNFASWGGGDSLYHVEDLNNLIKAVDFISVHTYPMHDTHYNPIFWGVSEEESDQPFEQKIESAMDRATGYAISQFEHTLNYMKSLGVEKPMHIGETGWASYSNSFYGENGSKATDEYKQALYYKKIRKWSEIHGVSCFYFEAFDEIWKDAGNPGGSENYFGLFTVDGKAKYALWDYVESGLFGDLFRDGNPIEKTYDGNFDALIQNLSLPPYKQELEVDYHKLSTGSFER